MEKGDLWIMFAIIFIALGAGVLSAVQHYKSVKSSQKNDSLTTELLSKTNQLADANRRNEILQEQINSKANNIIDAQSETIKRITGVGIPEVSFTAYTKYKYDIHLRNDTDYSMFDVLVTVISMDDILTCPRRNTKNQILLDAKCVAQYKNTVGQYTITPSLWGLNINHQLSLKEGLNHFQIEISLRSGFEVKQYVLNVKNGYIVGTAHRFYTKKEEYVIKDKKSQNLEITDEHWDTYFFPHFDVRVISFE